MEDRCLTERTRVKPRPRYLRIPYASVENTVLGNCSGPGLALVMLKAKLATRYGAAIQGALLEQKNENVSLWLCSSKSVVFKPLSPIRLLRNKRRVGRGEGLQAVCEHVCPPLLT